MDISKSDIESGPVIYFDDCCKLCAGVIGIITHAKAGRNLTYLPLQRLSLGDDTKSSLDEVRVFYKGEWISGAEGVMVVLCYLGGRYRVVWYLLKLLPDKVLDKVYKVIAKNRYRWFGKRSMCSANLSIAKD